MIPTDWRAPRYSPAEIRDQSGFQGDWLVSAVVLNWNAARHTCDCLESLSRQTHAGDRLEVIVVDNGSKEDTTCIQEALQDYQREKGWKQSRWIRLDRNHGIPAGYNIGLEHVSPQSDGLLRLDNDVILDPRFVECAVTAMNRWPSLAVVGGAQWGEGHRVAGLPSTIRWRELEFQHFAPGGEEGQPVDCDSIPGCALLVRRKAIRGMKVLFDPRLWVLHDETDLMIRLKAAGWRVGYLSAAQCVHQKGVSTGKVPDFFQYVSARNMILLAKRYAPFPDRLWSYRAAIRSLLQAVLSQNRSAARGFADGLMGNPWRPRLTQPLPQQPED